ncbi:MAG: hypothetical protein ABS76_03280 [Pelagibacterium sp. SCN 64-44]|nr:MAG: hypothetical protein ABS76_03280 [Pelagibacterium sp. SCN 64-44]
MSQPSPILTGLACRCPRCGKGKLFSGYLNIAPACDQCGLDYGFADSGDGPAVFVIFLVAPLIIVLALLVEASFTIQPWMHLVLWIPTTIVLSLALLPPFKGVLINLQYRNDAREGRP